ncbi:hypothetical protein D3C72_1564690 [compost metagenome]
MFLAALIAFAAAGDVELPVQGHDDGEFFGHDDFGNVVLAQIIAGVVRQHHVNAAQRVMHGRAALAGFKAVSYERAF